MRIMVFDVPAEHGGALTILKQYYGKAVNDSKNEWIFIVSTSDLEDTKNVKVIKYPWIKRSWFHRFYFDIFSAKKIVERYKADEILSLQNVIIKNINIQQTLYLHQPLPFVEKRYRVTENFKFWIYQNIISKMIFRSIRDADKVIVQTKWMKEACLARVKTDPKKFVIKQPDTGIRIKNTYKQESDSFKLFFYPASGAEYKNHSSIVEATKKLMDLKIINFKVVFTLSGDENKHIAILYKKVKENNLPIHFIGQIGLEDVYDYYSKSILIFPSYIETFGLPMLEARLHESPILASDCEFSHEILDNYDRVEFFDPFNNQDLSEKMMYLIKNNSFEGRASGKNNYT